MMVKKAGDCGLPRWEGLRYMVSEGSVLKYSEDNALFARGSCESEILIRSECCLQKLLFVLVLGVNSVLFREQNLFLKVNNEPRFCLSWKFGD